MFLVKIGRCIKKFLKQEDGASAIEYVIIVAMVALVVVGVSPGIGTAVKDTFDKIETALTPATTPSGGTSG
jgi:pilus assembly protein Flp/PilA